MASSLYLDYNATTPLEPEVLTAIQEALTVAWGNPSSSYDAGKKAKEVVASARKSVAMMIGAKSSDIVFTSGGTEANNMILQTAVKFFGTQRLGDETPCNSSLPHFVSSEIEHPAVNMVLKHLSDTNQAEVSYAPVSTQTCRVEVEGILSSIKANTIMVTVMLANNETGIIQDVREISRAVKSLKRGPGETKRILLHTDAAQAIGKIPVDVGSLAVDYLTVVGHKFYGPRIGAVYAADLEAGRTPLYPMLFGGGQERDYRPGTENTGMIAGLGKACELVIENIDRYEKQMREVRDHLEAQLQKTFPGRLHFNGKLEGSQRLPNTCNVSILGEGLEGHKVLSRCRILQASVGAACHAQDRASHILLAIGVEETVARNALRLSVGRSTTITDIDIVVSDLREAVCSL